MRIIYPILWLNDRKVNREMEYFFRHLTSIAGNGFLERSGVFY